MSHDRPVALVTGASSGIGVELARVFAREGHDLVLVARRESELRKLADELSTRFGADATVIVADLSQPDGAQQVYDATLAARHPIDVLVNNAGLGSNGRFVETDATLELQLLAVNIVALTELTKLFLPGMVERRSGHVLNLASLAAFQPGPFMAVYYASKAYVLSFTEAIAEELVGTGVTATALCPGPVPSEFQEVAGMSHSALLLRSPGSMSPEAVAEAGYAGMSKGRRIVIPGAVNKVMAQSIRVSPRRGVVKLVRLLHPPS